MWREVKMDIDLDIKKITVEPQFGGKAEIIIDGQSKILDEVGDDHPGWKALADPEVPKLFSFNPTCFWFMGRLY